MVRPSRRLTILLLIFASIAVAMVLDPPPSQEKIVVVAAPRMPARSAQRSDLPATSILEIRPRQDSETASDAFAVRDWNPPPPPPPPAPVVIEVPRAPALPYRYIGKQRTDGAWTVFLAKNDDTYVVRQKDVMDNQYRVEKIAPPTMTIIYLPLDERQTLAIGGAE